MKERKRPGRNNSLPDFRCRATNYGDSVALLMLLVIGANCHAADNMVSPDGRVSATLTQTSDRRLRHSVTFRGKRVVEPSLLGITVDGVDLGSSVVPSKPEHSEFDQTYVTRGNHRHARNHYRMWRFPVTHKSTGLDYFIEFRVYNDGVAFRYVIPGSGRQHVDAEASSWKLAAGSKVWFFERLAKKWKLKSYAGEWISTDIENLHTASPVGPVQGTPLVLELPGGLGFAAVTKAALSNYSGMRLEAVGDRTLVSNFTEETEGFDVDGPITTPWRVTMLVDDLNGLVNSNLMTNLNPEPDRELFPDTGYIKPGRCAWSWETLGLGSPETQRTFIDLAAEMGLEYSLVDDGWKDWPDPWQTINSLCDHARTRNVGVWVWVHSQDILDPASDYLDMQQFLDRVAAAGAVGVKIDFMNGESKELIDFEIAALRLAAGRRLMINFHGCHASTGEARTWPNEMTREGIRGIEVNKMKEGPLPASHNAALPFTRFIVGHADYTPILYSNPGPTTWAHQLATAVAFTSPLQIYAEHPATMMHTRILRDAVEVTKLIPSVWDETLVLADSRIGRLAAMARRSGDDWFVSLLNAEARRTYELDLSFLPDHEYRVTMVRDDLDAEPFPLEGLLNQKAKLKGHTTSVPFKVERAKWRQSDRISIRLASGGGFVAVLRK